MKNNQQAYDGTLISELDVKRFLKANKDIPLIVTGGACLLYERH